MADATLAGAGQGLEHGGVGHEAVGDQPLGQALEAGAGGAAGGNGEVVHSTA
jgi:hypothetical protein